MKAIFLIIASFLAFNSIIFSQNNIEKTLMEIEKNNTTLLSLRKMGEADKLGNKTGVYLQNPEFEFNYLWGSPTDIGNRTDIHIRQSFDFPTAYGFRNKIADGRNEQLDIEYQKQLKEILLSARLLCIELVYTNSLIAELSKRSKHSEKIALAIKAKYDAGESSIVEYNKTQLSLLNLNKLLETTNIEKVVLLADLASLNGSNHLDFEDNTFQTPLIPIDFEHWYKEAEQSNPVLSWIKQEIEISQKQEKLNSAMSLPQFHAGYMSERVVGVIYQGITVGMSIPLWENKNTVKYAKAHTDAILSLESDNKQKFYNDLKALHTKAIGLQKNADDYRKLLESFDNSKFLDKSLEEGEITLIEYFLELSIYYESFDNLLQLERELNKTVAELNQYL